MIEEEVHGEAEETEVETEVETESEVEKPEGEQPKDEEPKKEEPTWFERRIAKQTARLHDERDAHERTKAELERIKRDYGINQEEPAEIKPNQQILIESLNDKISFLTESDPEILSLAKERYQAKINPFADNQDLVLFLAHNQSYLKDVKSLLSDEDLCREAMLANKPDDFRDLFAEVRASKRLSKRQATQPAKAISKPPARPSHGTSSKIDINKLSMNDYAKLRREGKI